MNLLYNRRSAAASKRDGFTLVEMLVVIAVISLLLAVSAPAFLGSITGSRMSQAGDQFAGLLSEAQQRAVATGRPIEIRLYRQATDGVDSGSGGGYFRSMLVLEYYQQGEHDPRTGTASFGEMKALDAPIALARRSLENLPGGYVISENAALSTLITELPESRSSGDTAVKTYVRRGDSFEEYHLPTEDDFRSFIIYPETTSLNIDEKWFFTIVSDLEATNDASKVTNFYTIQIDPFNARMTLYRP